MDFCLQISMQRIDLQCNWFTAISKKRSLRAIDITWSSLRSSLFAPPKPKENRCLGMFFDNIFAWYQRAMRFPRETIVSVSTYDVRYWRGCSPRSRRYISTLDRLSNNVIYPLCLVLQFLYTIDHTTHRLSVVYSIIQFFPEVTARESGDRVQLASSRIFRGDLRLLIAEI